MPFAPDPYSRSCPLQVVPRLSRIRSPAVNPRESTELIPFQGVASDIEIHAREALELRRRLDEMYAKHTGKSVDQIHEDMDRDRFFTAEQAKEYGLIDGTLESRNGALAAAQPTSGATS